MAMATGGAGASALIMALNSAKTVKSTKALFDTTKELNKAQSNGAIDGLNQVFQQMQQSGPVQSAFKVLFGQIQAETTTSSIDLMNSLLELFASEAFQVALKLFIDTLNALVWSVARLVDLINALPDWLTGQGSVGGGYNHPDVPGYSDSPFATTGGGSEIFNIPWWESMGYSSEEEAMAALGMI